MSSSFLVEAHIESSITWDKPTFMDRVPVNSPYLMSRAARAISVAEHVPRYPTLARTLWDELLMFYCSPDGVAQGGVAQLSQTEPV